MVYKEKKPLILIALIAAGLVIGGVLGDYLGANRDFEVLKRGFELGISQPFRLNLGILDFSLGFMLRVNIASALGIIAGIFIYKKI